MPTDIDTLLNLLSLHQQKYEDSIHLVPSENTMSPLAKLPFLLDAHARYFLDDLRLFGNWSFPGGKELGAIEQEVLIPLLQKYAKATYVNARALSGMNCMTIALCAMASPGDIVYVIPAAAGGHACTTGVAQSMGLDVRYIPFRNEFDVDHEAFAAAIERDRPKLIYLDQATFLFPIDIRPIRAVIDRFRLATTIHCDSSHLNGLIFGGVVENPLECGAHSFGGSTHKTLPGPHKGFIATNDRLLANAIQVKADQLVSQHHMASTISLAITMLEFEQCRGVELMRDTMANTRSFCAAIERNARITLHAGERGHTGCHQIWAFPKDGDARVIYERMLGAGLVTNIFNGLPGLDRPAYRLSLAEFTRLGATAVESAELASLLCRATDEGANLTSLREQVRQLRRALAGPKYCYAQHELPSPFAQKAWA